MLWSLNLAQLNSSPRQVLACITCNLAAFLAGTCSTWLAPKAVWITEDNNEITLSHQEFSWVIAVVDIGKFIFVIPSGILADRYGRKRTLICAIPMLLVAWIIAVFTRNIVALYIMRVLQGCYMAVAFTVTPMYVAEVSSPKIRGFLGGQFTVMLAAGTLFCYITGSYIAYHIYLYILLILPILFLLIFLFMPESPYYYFMIDNKKKATESYQWLLNDDINNNDLINIENAVKNDMLHKIGWYDLIATKSDRKALFIVQLVCVTKCAIGIPSFITFGRQMFETFNNPNQMITSEQAIITMSVFLMLGALIASLMTDLFGRRSLLIWTAIGTTISNIIICLYLYLCTKTNINLIGTEWIMYIAVAVFCLTSNMGAGHLLFVIQAEFFPSHTRSKGGAISGLTSAVVIFTIAKLYQTLTDEVGIYINYLIYAISAFLTTILIYTYVPESARKTLAEVNDTIKDIS